MLLRILRHTYPPPSSAENSGFGERIAKCDPSFASTTAFRFAGGSLKSGAHNIEISASFTHLPLYTCPPVYAPFTTPPTRPTRSALSQAYPGYPAEDRPALCRGGPQPLTLGCAILPLAPRLRGCSYQRFRCDRAGLSPVGLVRSTPFHAGRRRVSGAVYPGCSCSAIPCGSKRAD